MERYTYFGLDLFDLYDMDISNVNIRRSALQTLSTVVAILEALGPLQTTCALQSLQFERVRQSKLRILIAQKMLPCGMRWGMTASDSSGVVGQFRV